MNKPTKITGIILKIKSEVIYMLFAKSEYKEIILPFVYDNNPDDLYARMISIEAYGNIDGENKYCYASYLADLEFIDELSAVLKNSYDKTLK